VFTKLIIPMSNKNKTKIIGILNLTHDSFFDGGKYLSKKQALQHATNMIDSGVDIIDIGAESSKPGFSDVDVSLQLDRIIPIMEKLRNLNDKIILSVDTRSSIVASEAIKRGASIINDVSSGTHDSDMFDIVAEAGVEIIITHMPSGHKRKQTIVSKNIMKDIKKYLTERIGVAVNSGIKRKKIIVDPGICFGKKGNDNVKILQNLSFLVDTFNRVCLGASNKKFSSKLLKNYTKKDLYIPSIVTTTKAVMSSVEFVRVHDVSITNDVLKICNKTLSV
tara:strand:- start:8303 stop:9136 length:834 start_codon:yes stop_codon:yes gene_type:complete